MSEKTRVVITGATSGLGKEMAVQLARRGWRIALTGRREDKLKEVAKAVQDAGGEALILVGSVTEPAAVKAHYATIRETWGGVDWAILNAGIGDSEHGRRFNAEAVRRTFDTNVFGAAYWIEAVIPDMLRAKRGVIAGIASLAAYRGLPQSGSYSASKAALVTLLESTRIDLRGTGVDVVTVCPGFVKSELTARNNEKDMWFLLETDDGVRRLLAGIDRRKREVHFPWQLSLLMKYVIHNLPGCIYEPLAKRLIKRDKRPAAPAPTRA
ncbi:MAG: SDR family NAD(P)-dependent oxidoreductase [Elusimicrobia bacterium]|nr:SDR family NAD(P)-dependent oxidoreductase [Elusimicrobiota bacterium]